MVINSLIWDDAKTSAEWKEDCLQFSIMCTAQTHSQYRAFSLDWDFQYQSSVFSFLQDATLDDRIGAFTHDSCSIHRSCFCALSCCGPIDGREYSLRVSSDSLWRYWYSCRKLSLSFPSFRRERHCGLQGLGTSLERNQGKAFILINSIPLTFTRTVRYSLQAS